METLANFWDIDAIKVGLGVVIGFIASVFRDSLNITNKSNQEFKVKKQQKLEELLNLLEITNKDSLISMSLRVTEDSNKQIDMLKKTLQNQFEDLEVIKHNEDNYAKIKTISSLYLKKHKQSIDIHISMIKSLDLYRQVSLENAISVNKLMHKFRDKQELMGNDAEKVDALNQKIKEDKYKEEELEKKIDISLNKLKDVIVKELNS